MPLISLLEMKTIYTHLRIILENTLNKTIWGLRIRPNPENCCLVCVLTENLIQDHTFIEGSGAQAITAAESQSIACGH